MNTPAGTIAGESPFSVVRRLRFEFDHDVRADWHPRLPEFAAGANAISLLMPHAEPFVISAVRDGAADCDEADRRAAEWWASQEATHFKAHRQFNAAITERSAVARLLDRLGAWMFARLRRRSVGFRVAFAAAFELVAFSSARWAEQGLQKYFAGADDVAASLFLWHLAEEVEHKGVAHDVFLSAPSARRVYPAALLVAFISLIGFTVVGGIALFATTRSAWNPIRWMRLVGWGFSLAFVLLPVLATSLGKRFHPDQLVDPPWMRLWLRDFDPATNTLPVWTEAGSAPISIGAQIPLLDGHRHADSA